MKEILDHLPWNIIWSALIVVVVGILIFVAHRVYINIIKSKEKEELSTKNLNIIKIIYDIIKIVIVIIGIILILQINGVNVTSLIAGLGIAGAILGLAIQNPLKDIIAGYQIISDRYFSIGDAVKYKDFEGVVTSFTLRTTKITSFDNQRVLCINNRLIEEIQFIELPIEIVIPINLAYEEDPKQVHNDLQDIASIIEKDELIEKALFKGTNEMRDSSIEYVIFIYCEPNMYKPAKRKALYIIQNELNKRKYIIPYNKMDVYRK